MKHNFLGDIPNELLWISTSIFQFYTSHVLDSSHNPRQREHTRKAAIYKICVILSIVPLQLVM